MNKRRVVASLVSAMTLALVIVAWVTLAPTRLGGQVAYVIVDGNSMEPGMHRGDLAVVRRSHAYAEGDVVTYRHPGIGPVIHRIVGRNGERYTLKGDHNSFLDSFEPAQADIVGKLWFHVPALGRLITPFQQRRNAILLLVAVSLATFGGGSRAAARKHKDGTVPGPDGRTARRRPVMGSTNQNLQECLVALGAAALVFLALALFAFGRPATRQVPDDIVYTQSGAFTYSAPSTDGAIYDTPSAVTGDPVFRRLSDSITVRFDYSFASGSSFAGGGTHRLVAEVSDVGGWKRTIELQPSRLFEGAASSVEGVLRLAEVDAMIRRLEGETGVHSPSYTLAIAPQVDVAGTLGGREFRDAFAPLLVLKLDEFQLSLARRNPAETDPVAPAAGGVLRGTRTETNSVALLITEVDVPTARWVALLGLGIIIVSAGLFVLDLTRHHPPAGDSAARFNSRYGLAVVTVRSVPVTRASVIDVASVDDLAKVALRNGGLILQETRPGFHAYFVQEGAVVYRYAVVDAVPRRRRSEAAA